MKIIQEAFNSTLMSSLKAAYEHYYSKKISASDVFGLSGMAFTTAYSKGLGPCAPYTFNMDGLKTLCKDNLGLSIMDEEFSVTSKSTKAEKIEATKNIKTFLDDGFLVLLNTYEVQLITGYNETHFITTNPWDAPSVTPDLKLDTLEGIKDFLLYSKIEKVNINHNDLEHKNVIKYALEQFTNIKTMDFITQGIKAYDFLLDEINSDNANDLGMWWSSSVWSECKYCASKYVEEHYQDDELTNFYKELGAIFDKLSNKEGQLETKIEQIKLAKDLELKIEVHLKALI